MKKNIFLAVALAALAIMPSCKTTAQKENLTNDELNGKWTITTVNDKEIKIENTPFVDFLAESRVHAQVGCNIYNSEFTYDAATGTLTFPENGQLTMMMCPDMATESAILEAIRATRKVEKATAENCINFIDAEGNILMTLCK